jgi:glucan-binding YG repeat protein
MSISDGEPVSEEALFGDGVTEDSTAQEEEVLSDSEEALLAALPTAVQEVNISDWVDTGSGKYMLHKDEENFYTLADGLLYIRTVNDKTAPSSDTAAHSGYTGYYLFDNQGVLITGRKTVQPEVTGASKKQEYYFTDTDIAELYTEYEGTTGTLTPWNSDLGQMKRAYWLWTGTTFRYYDSSGRFLSVSELKEINTARNKYTGYYNIRGNYYCLKSNGAPKTGHVSITEGTKPGKYYFQPQSQAGEIPGAMFKGGWLHETTSNGDRWRYYKSDGTFYDRGIVATKLDTSVMGDDVYLLSASGYILKSTMKKASNGAYYATDKYGRIYKDKLVRYNNVRYYFGSNGKRVSWTNCWHRCPGASNRYYYFGSAGRVVEKKGWQKIVNTKGTMVGWFYFSNNGNHYMNGWAMGLYFRPNGQLASGLTKINDNYYFFEVSTESEHKGTLSKNTWIQYNNKKYYATANGVLYQNAWRLIDGSYYYFQKNCSVKTNAFIKKGSTYGYVDSTGKFTTGWVIVDNATNKVRYINPDAPGYVTNTSRVIDGLRYYFDKDGYRITDLTDIYKGPYYLEVDRVNGVMTVYNSSKTVPVKTIRVSVGASGSETPTGTYTLKKSLRWQPLMGPSWGQYGTHLEGAGQGGIYIHSVAGSEANSYSLPSSAYNLLGSPASHGCIRTCVADAKWVYENCNGATIRVFDGTYKSNETMKGPLGRNPLVPLQYPYNFDPTDPAV